MTINVQLFQLSDQRCDRENDDIIMGLARQPRQLPFHLFYDDAGSALFQQITETPEYYLTRTEHHILHRYKQDILNACGNQRVWIEPGAGSCEKAAMLLSESYMAAYVALDIAATPLQQAAISLHANHPAIPVYLLVGDFRNVIPQVQSVLPGGARTIFYPGSSIGNFAPEAAIDWLSKLAILAGADGNLLIGFDVPKDPVILHAAYNDAAGITAAFHLNMLHHLRRRGFQLQPEDFSHMAFYNENDHRIEMHLKVERSTTVRWRDVTVSLNANETILTEYSYKYPLSQFSEMAARSGWRYRCQWQDDSAWFTVSLFDRA